MPNDNRDRPATVGEESPDQVSDEQFRTRTDGQDPARQPSEHPGHPPPRPSRPETKKDAAPVRTVYRGESGYAQSS